VQLPEQGTGGAARAAHFCAPLAIPWLPTLMVALDVCGILPSCKTGLLHGFPHAGGGYSGGGGYGGGGYGGGGYGGGGYGGGGYGGGGGGYGGGGKLALHPLVLLAWSGA